MLLRLLLLDESVIEEALSAVRPPRKVVAGMQMARDRQAAKTAGQQWKLLLTAALTVAALVVLPVRVSSSSDLKRRENAEGNVKGNGMSRKALMSSHPSTQ
jgi:hypothetical protein